MLQWRRDQKFFPTARPERMEKKINAVNGTIHIKELYALKIDLYILSVFRKSLVISKRPFFIIESDAMAPYTLHKQLTPFSY